MLGYWVYMLASRQNGTLYVGVTSDLLRRVAEHREAAVSSFTKKYGVTRLVWFETHDSIEAHDPARKRRRSGRAWKVALIKANAEWRDLWVEVTGWPGKPGHDKSKGWPRHAEPARPSASRDWSPCSAVQDSLGELARFHRRRLPVVPDMPDEGLVADDVALRVEIRFGRARCRTGG